MLVSSPDKSPELQAYIYNCLLNIPSMVKNRYLKFSVHKLDVISIKLNPFSP